MKKSDIDRRHFLTGIAGFATLPVLVSPTKAADPKTLIAVVHEDPPLINPGISSDISSYAAGSLVYGGLAWMDPKGVLHPDLAESWETSPDGKSFTFHLRRGVTWHDGKPFSSADAKFSLEKVTAKVHPVARNAYKQLDRIDAPDDHTIVIHMKQPVAAFMNVPTAFFPILPRHLWEGTEFATNPYNKKPIGTGPFKFVEYRPGDRLRYVKNEAYWDKPKPTFDEVVIRIIPDAASRVAAFEKGEVDALFSFALPATEIQRLSKLPGVAMPSSKISGSAWIANINGRNAPYNNRMVRQALAHAIDRRFIRETVLPGISENMVGPLWPASPLYNTALIDYAFDPAKANALLDEAGFPRKADGTRFEFRFLWAAGDVRVSKMGDVIAQNLANVGIKTILRPLDRAALNQIGYVGGQFDMIIDSLALGPDPDIGTERLYRSDNILPAPATNNSGYSNPEVDKLFDEQRVLMDPAKRKAVYDRIQEIIWADIPVLPICSYVGPAAVRSNYALDVFTTYHVVIENFARARPAG